MSVGIPTFNRASDLERAVRSALAQEHDALEVIVSDDASTDATPDVGAALAAQDNRVRFVSQPQNLGHAANYDWVLQHARGEYFMWLSDDDWIDPNYVSRCLAALDADPDVVLACGQGRYYHDGAHVVDERPIDLLASRAGARLVRFFSRVSVNGPLFGVMRREQLSFPQVVGGDWLFVGGMAMRGKVVTVRDAHVHRSLAGMGGDAERLARSFGLGGIAARHHHFVVARSVWRTFRRQAPVSAAVSALLVLVRFPGFALLRRIGLGRVEPRIARWLREREGEGR